MWDRLNRFAILIAIVTFGFNGGTAAACFAAGQFCEYALIGPSENGVVENHLRELATSDSAPTLSVKDQQMLFGEGRVDLYAQASNRAYAIGSYPKASIVTYEISQDGKWAVLVSNSSSTDTDKLFDITLYDASAKLVRATASLECTAFDKPPEARFLNLNYESKDRVLIFDLISTCEFLKINDVHYLVFGSRKTSGRAFIALNEKYMVARVVGSTDGASTLPTETFLYTDDEIASAHKSGEREREACVTKLMSMPSTSGFEECRFPWTLVRKPADPELGDFIYFAAVSKIATETSVLRLECLEEHLKIDRLQGQVFARCQHNMGGGGTDPRSYMTLTGGAVDGQHFEVSFVCPCFGFDIRNPRFVTKNKVQFELLANSGTLEMGSFTVALKGDKPPLDRAPGASRGTYVMAISDGGVALSLAPVEIAAN